MLNSLVIGDLEIKTPIIQGGMGIQVSTAPLAIAVAECGGAGTIATVGLGYGTEENESNFAEASRKGLENELRTARAATDGVVGVNILAALSNYKELARVSAVEKADFIISGAGLPMNLPELTEGHPTKLIPIVSSARAASILIRAWKKRYDRIPDAFVVEGPLAGGHLGFKAEDLSPHSDAGNRLESLVSEVLQVTNDHGRTAGTHIPVIAAGGVFDGADIAKFFKLGADGVQMATRFVTTHECSVAQEFKDLYISATEDDLVIIPSPAGMPGRAIRTKLVDRVVAGERVPFRCNYHCLSPCSPRTAPYCIAQALFNAVSGKLDEAVVFAGSNVSRVDRIISVQELMDELTSETEAALNAD